MPPKPSNGPAASGPTAHTSRAQASSSQPDSSSSVGTQQNGGGGEGAAPRKKRHRGGRRHRKDRRQSFAAPSESEAGTEGVADRPALATVQEGQQSSSFYKLGNRAGSDTSLESEALLDHRDQNQNPLRQRRGSLVQSQSSGRPSQSQAQSSLANQLRSQSNAQSTSYAAIRPGTTGEASDDELATDDRTPLIKRHKPSKSQSGYGGLSSSQGESRRPPRRRSTASSSSTRKRMPPRQMSTQSFADDYDVNNPPSQPGSPTLDAQGGGFDDVMLPDFGGSPHTQRNQHQRGGEHVIDIDRPAVPESPGAGGMRRRGTGTSPVEDVCLPFEQMTEIGEEEEDYMRQQGSEQEKGGRRHRRKQWPDLSVFEEWSHEEKEERTMEGIRAKKVDEPVSIGGRLRPQRGTWQREAEEASFRFTYFNEELDSSLRSHTISGLQQLGHSFQQLFIPDPPELEDSSSDEDDDEPFSAPFDRSGTPVNGHASRAGTRQSSILEHLPNKTSSGERTPPRNGNGRPKRYGPRPIFWLDVLQPTWDEMKVISRAFGIHKLTAEDIMEQEAREKVELFRNYYFVNYRTFEQDERSEDHMDPVNMYFVVFKGGVISFHFSQMPHPPNVRRRIRQLAEHQYTDSDWIAYAIIDNITDAYAPLIEQIEQEVDDIDDEVLKLHSQSGSKVKGPGNQKKITDPPHERGDEEKIPPDARRDMLIRVGECRKRVMGLYRLLGNKADVIKGLAKRCNEQWQVAPRSDVGLYLGDIQDHIVTMTGNLTHYESILSRAHSNYLAQINIGMNERAEQTNDVLGRLTVLGTIVLPMNIITGMWGMNCLVPGQVEDNPTLWWFFGLTSFLLLFGLVCFFVAKRVYNIV